MDEEGHQVNDEAGGARLTLLRDVRQRERPDDHDQGHQPQRAL
jgi:hypothetical protein